MALKFMDGTILSLAVVLFATLLLVLGVLLFVYLHTMLSYRSRAETDPALPPSELTQVGASIDDSASDTLEAGSIGGKADEKSMVESMKGENEVSALESAEEKDIGEVERTMAGAEAKAEDGGDAMKPEDKIQVQTTVAVVSAETDAPPVLPVLSYSEPKLAFEPSMC